jgi:deazaflavin-dependent oxidoreductase (nitroreductase family)
VLHHLDRIFIKLSNNRTSLTAIMTGIPVITLTTMGAKSKKRRTVPLLGIPKGEKLILIPSNWGKSFYPGWYYNLKTDRNATVEYRGVINQYTAIVAEGAERADCWARAVDLYPGYAAYKRRAGKRQIPVILLLPKLALDN